MDLLCSLRGDFLDHGEEVVEEAAPGFEFAQPGALEFGVGPRSVERIRLIPTLGEPKAKPKMALRQTAHRQH